MSSNSRISQAVKCFVKSIIESNNVEPTCVIKYEDGSGSCAGFNSKPIAVDITDNNLSLQLFIKEPLKLEICRDAPVEKLIANEIYFYNTVYPAYQEFSNGHGVTSFFVNVPQCYGISGDLIALDNLTQRGFRLFGEQGGMDEDHIVLTMETLAKFHAISYALKDQKKELYDTFIKNIEICLGDIYRIGKFDNFIGVNIKRFLRSLDPVEDKKLLDASVGLTEYLKDALLNVDNYVTDYSAIIHGDCWCNNIMYLYEEDTQKSPTDIMFVDWQILRQGSPALELSYFFYTVSSESTIVKLEYFLKLYHNALSENMRRLGSDPDRLYPYAILKEEWKKFAKYAFAMAFDVIRGLLLEKDEVANLDEYVEDFKKTVKAQEEDATSMAGIRNEHLYFVRMKNILKHFVEHDLL